MIVFDDEITKALERIARTRDGRVLHVFLQKMLMSLSPSPDSGALQTFEGGRRFAQLIKAAMDKAIVEDVNGRPGKSSGTSSGDNSLVVIAARGPVTTGSSRGTRRRVRAADGSGGGSAAG